MDQKPVDHHPPPPHPNPAHPAPIHPSAHHAPGHATEHKKQPKSNQMPLLVIATVAIAVTVFVGIRVKNSGPEAPSASFQDLVEQIHKAANGSITSPHVFGGELTVERGETGVNVTAHAVPPKACVQAGWQLVREGTLIVNGILPKRVSAGKLSELCSQTPEGATLTWIAEP